MSSLPLILSLIEELETEPSYYGNDFGLGLHPHHIHRSASQNPRRHHYHQVEPASNHLVNYALPLALLTRLSNAAAQRRGDGHKEGAGTVAAVGKDGFQVCMDVSQFKPSELNVKVLDNYVVVEGKHEEREDDHGFISRHFVRRYALPKGYDADKVVSTLSSDGVLSVNVPKPQIEEKSNERVIQIQQVGPAHLNVKDNAQEKSGDGPNTANGSDSGDKK